MTLSSTSVNISLSSDIDKLWRQFRPHQMEMVVIKNGRKMFPKLEYRITGLDPLQYYNISLRMERVDDTRHKFCSARWQICGKGEPPIPEKTVYHTDGMQSGEYWMNKNISFDFVRLSNSIDSHGDNVIIIQSMHKYIPVVDVYNCPVPSNQNTHIIDMQKQRIAQLRVNDTDFIAVTAYQNQKITEIKIANNPFAKGFREKGDKRKCSTPLSTSSSEPSPKQHRTMFPFFSQMTATLPTLPTTDYNWFQHGFFNPVLLSGPSQMVQPPFPGETYPTLPHSYSSDPTSQIATNCGFMTSSLDMTPPSESSLTVSSENIPEIGTAYSHYSQHGMFPVAPYSQMTHPWLAYDSKLNQFSYAYSS